VSRFIDRGAFMAGWVGLGMAVTVVVSFVLVIPIEFLVAPSALLGGMMIGYYANARSGRTGGPWRRVIMNALWAGLITGVTYMLLMLGLKAIFFGADNGYRDASMGGPITCEAGAECVYMRYLDFVDDPAAFEAQGVTDVESFTQFYWTQQLVDGGTLVMLSLAGSLFGGLMYGATNRRKPDVGAGAVDAG
jgi:hypothetical protein